MGPARAHGHATNDRAVADRQARAAALSYPGPCRSDRARQAIRRRAPAAPEVGNLAISGLRTEAANALLADNFAPWVLASGLKVEKILAEGGFLRLPFAAELCRRGGILCGQALSSGADSAMVLALAAANGAFKPCTTIDLSMGDMRPISQAGALLAARLMRLGKTLTFCSCAVSAAGTDKPAAFATGTYALLE